MPPSALRAAPPVELDLLILSFLGHFAWEQLQAPLYDSVAEVAHATGVMICLRATLGDLVIALSAFWLAALAGGGRGWTTRPTLRAVAVFLAVGLVVTVGLEAVNTGVLDRWSYGPQMPRLPLLGTGLSPVLQWLAVPSLVLWYLSRLR